MYAYATKAKTKRKVRADKTAQQGYIDIKGKTGGVFLTLYPVKGYKKREFRIYNAELRGWLKYNRILDDSLVSGINKEYKCTLTTEQLNNAWEAAMKGERLSVLAGKSL